MGERFLDKYSILHFLWGIVAYFIGIGWKEWLLLHILFEILENTLVGMQVINALSPFWPGGKPSPDTFINSLGDTAAAMLGWWIASLVI